jgi:eukaryotic-like serine/threonine-protein kinase
MKEQLKRAFVWIWYNKSRRDTSILLFCTLIVLYLIILFVDRAVMPVIVHRGGTAVVPNLVDLSLQQADSVLGKQDLELQILAEETDPSRQPGTIISQIPAPGTKMKEGRTVKVKVSKVEEDVIVPKLKGVSIRQAELLLAQTSLQLGEIIWVPSDSFPKDVVVESSPPPGISVPPGISINVTASLGSLPDTVSMPDLVGKNLEECKKILLEMGLQVGNTKSKTNDDFLPGTVLDQSIQPGDRVARGTEVDLEVSKTE